MRRLRWTLLVTSVLFTLAPAGAASAKGIFDHAKVTVSGAGLPGGIVTLGTDGGAFVAGSGVWDDKWTAPNIGGTLEPNADLGPALDVRVVMRCDGGGRARYDQTLYPNAPEGPQLFTPESVEICGDAVPSGYDGVGYALERLLRKHGVTFHAIRTPQPSPTTQGDEPGTSASASALAVVGVPFALALIAGEEIVRRRRRRR
jgi:hypothetical protein